MKVFSSVAKDITNYESITWIDARFSLQDPLFGAKLYEQLHIKRAVHWDLEKDLSDMQRKGGRHPLPDQNTLTMLYRNSGLKLDDPIVIYDNGGEPFAARAWWILKYGGFQNVTISLEGFEELKQLGIPTESGHTTPVPSHVEPEWEDSILATKSEVKEITTSLDRGTLLDARAAVRYSGEQEPLDAIAGHIPGAKNFDWSQLVANGRFDSEGEDAKQLHDLIASDNQVTVYCGSGVTAAPVYAMLAQQGHASIKLYAGSYSDWIEDGDLEVETGVSL